MNISVTAPLDRKRWLAALQSGEAAFKGSRSESGLSNHE